MEYSQAVHFNHWLKPSHQRASKSVLRHSDSSVFLASAKHLGVARLIFAIFFLNMPVYTDIAKICKHSMISVTHCCSYTHCQTM